MNNCPELKLISELDLLISQAIESQHGQNNRVPLLLWTPMQFDQRDIPGKPGSITILLALWPS